MGKIKTETNERSKKVYVSYDVKKTSYRDWLNRDTDLMATVATDGENLKINDCYKVVSLEFDIEHYNTSIKTEADANKAKKKMAKNVKDRLEKVNKIRKALDAIEAHIRDQESTYYDAVDHALALKDLHPKQKEIGVHRSYSD